jgi:hypothetical protein
MTCKALTTVLALIALPMPASGTEHNLCHRWQRRWPLHHRDGRVISRATGNTVIMHDGVSGQVFGDGPKWGKWRRPAPDQ